MTPHVTVIGCDGSPLAPEAAAVIAAASLVAGARRHLAAAAIPAAARQLEITRLDACTGRNLPGHRAGRGAGVR